VVFPHGGTLHAGRPNQGTAPRLAPPPPPMLPGALGAPPPITRNSQGWPRIWANFKHLIGILSQNSGPTCEFWANPMKFTFTGPRAGTSCRATSTASGCRSATSRWGSVALSFRSIVHPNHTRFANIFGYSISETTMLPNPPSTGRASHRRSGGRGAAARGPAGGAAAAPRPR
jgi:hypothetical protein